MIAVLLRGGSFPVAYVYPPEMRATRDLLRRRTHFVRKRAELYAHIHNTAIQYNLPELGVHLATESNRKEVDQHFPDLQVRKIVQIDLAMIDAYDDVLKALEWETRPIDQSSVPLLTYMNRFLAVSMCSAPRLSPVLTAMLRQDQSRRFEWDGRGYGKVSRSRWRCLRNRCSSNSRSGVNLDRCLVQDLSCWW